MGSLRAASAPCEMKVADVRRDRKLSLDIFVYVGGGGPLAHCVLKGSDVDSRLERIDAGRGKK